MDFDQHSQPEEVVIGDLRFVPYLSAADIQSRIIELGRELRERYQGRKPLFLITLKGAFAFGADLIRAAALPCTISFVRLASYQGTTSSRQLSIILPPDPEEIDGRDVIIVEDIIDSGHTMASFLPLLQDMQPASLSIATLLFKPDALRESITPDYVGFRIPPDFVVGYGLDYDGYGRELAGIYRLEER